MNEQVRKHVDQAVERLRRGELSHAAAAFEAAVRLAPGDVTLRQRLGDVYVRLGSRMHAVREFQHVAGRYAADGQLLKAIAICKVILELDPDHQETLHALADLYALQYETVPMVPKLPASMSGAVTVDAARPELDPLADSAPLDLESLAVFRDALAGVALPELSVGDEEETVISAVRAAPMDLRKLPPSPLFSALDRPTFEAVIEKLDLRWMTAGETLVREGEQGDSMFVVVQGVVNVLHGHKIIAVMGQGAFFGEMALLTDSPRLATVVAAKDGLLFEIHRARLAEIAAQHPGVGGVIASFYQHRLLANVLRASPVFRPLNEGERSLVGESFVRHSLPPQTVLLEQGKPGAGLCVLLRGRCEVFHTGGRGEQVALPHLKEGDIFGEISALLDGPCTATVRTASFCEVLELPREEFKRLVLPNPQVRTMVQQVLTERIARSADLLEREHGILPDYIV